MFLIPISFSYRLLSICTDVGNPWQQNLLLHNFPALLILSLLNRNQYRHYEAERILVQSCSTGRSHNSLVSKKFPICELRDRTLSRCFDALMKDDNLNESLQTPIFLPPYGDSTNSFADTASSHIK